MATQQKERNTFTSGTGATEAVKDAGKDVASKAGSYVKDAKDAASDVASKAGSYVKEAASNVAGKTEEAASYVAHKAEDATTAMGHQMKTMAGSIRANAPHERMLGTAGAAVADTLESYGRELEEHGLSGIADDLTNTIRRHPMPAILIGIGLGFLIGRSLSR